MLERWQSNSVEELMQGGLSLNEVEETYELLVKMKQKASIIEGM